MSFALAKSEAFPDVGGEDGFPPSLRVKSSVAPMVTPMTSSTAMATSSHLIAPPPFGGGGGGGCCGQCACGA
ncbi:hypothetical protein FZ046_05675 [Mycolicibacterium grossiae]|nr:hypothetical protein FZ046_05675 [Mycolicibacterium grossiae]